MFLRFGGIMEEFDIEKAAAALLAQHGHRAARVAAERARRHEIAKQEEASNFWRAVARAAKQKVPPVPS
jgi:hypothetical protein